MKPSLALYVASAAACLVASVAAQTQSVLVTTTVNETHCVAESNVGNFFHYGAAMAAKGNSIYAIQYEGQNVTCCNFNLQENSNMTIDFVSSAASTTPCSNLDQCRTEGNCDGNATCVFGDIGSFQCQCTELYEGDGFTCSRKPHWSEWGEFGPYSQSCGAATRTRTRTCSKPPRCEGEDTDTELVTLAACPVPTTTTLPPTRYKACGTRNCADCPGGANTCKEGNLDADRHKSDLRSCPEGFQHHSYLDIERWWIIPDELIRVCSSIPPAPIAKYRYQMCGGVNCIGCDQEACQDQNQLHLVAASQADQSAQCPEGYSDFADSQNQTFRVCRSDEKFF